jgi:hypothetical protein
MSDDELKKLWQSGKQDNAPDTMVLLKRTRQELERLRRTISKRNRLEIGTAIVLMPVFALIAVFIPAILSKIGAALIVPACLFVIYKLKRTKKLLPVDDSSATLSEYLAQHRSYVFAEMKLLDSVLYWYLLPLMVPMLLFCIGLQHYRFAFGGVLLTIAVYALNKYVARKDFMPRIARLDKDIAELATED